MRTTERDYVGVKIDQQDWSSERVSSRVQSRHRRARQWPISKVLAKSPTALAVWIALVDEAESRRSNIATPTREELARAAGIKRLKTISTALTLLDRAGWIARTLVPITEGAQRKATLLRIEIRRMGRCTASYGAGPVRGGPAPLL